MLKDLTNMILNDVISAAANLKQKGRQNGRQKFYLVLYSNIWYLHHCCLLGFVKHLGVYLCRGQFSMSQKLRDGVDVSTEVKHHDGEGMPGTMESYLLGDASL